MTNNARLYRLWVCTIKVVSIAVAPAVFMFLRKQSLDGAETLFWACIAIFGAIACGTLLEVFVRRFVAEDSGDGECLVFLFSIVLIGMTIMAARRGIHSTELFVALVYVVVLLTFFRSCNDAFMEEPTLSCYSSDQKLRHNPFFQYLAFNTLPYLGVGGVSFILTTYGEIWAIVCSILVAIALFAFAIVDEVFRRTLCRSFFWDIDPRHT